MITLIIVLLAELEGVKIPLWALGLLWFVCIAELIVEGALVIDLLGLS